MDTDCRCPFATESWTPERNTYSNFCLDDIAYVVSHYRRIFAEHMLVDSGVPFEPRRSPKNYVRALPLFTGSVLTSCMLVTFQ